jgi:hypothetical protein
MIQALHIFKKDVRHLRFEIAIAISVVAAFAFIEARRAFWLVDPQANRTAAATLVMFLLPLAWWTLIGRVIHDEALPGDRQFWITRPYSWHGLLGAKILFVLAFINLPMLLAHAVIIRAYGLPLGAAIPGLLWSQLLLTVVFLLPVFALSAVTKNFVQLIVAVLAPAVIALLFAIAVPGIALGGFPTRNVGAAMAGYSAGYEWVKFYILFLIISAGGSAIPLWQYRRRGAFIGRCFAGATVIFVVIVMMYLPWTTTFRIQSWLVKQHMDISAVHANFVLDDKLLARVMRDNDDFMRVNLPIRITGLPPDVTAQVEGLSGEFDSPDGSIRGIYQTPSPYFFNMGQHFSLSATLDNAFYKQVKDEPITVRGTLYLTVYGRRQSTRVPIDDSSVSVPRVGVCSASQTPNRRVYFAICTSAFRFPPALVSYRFLESASDLGKSEMPVSQRRRISYSPFPADVGISPINQDYAFTSSRIPWEQAAVDTIEPLDHIKLKFEVNGLRLGDFELDPAAYLIPLQKLQKAQSQK